MEEETESMKDDLIRCFRNPLYWLVLSAGLSVRGILAFFDSRFRNDAFWSLSAEFWNKFQLPEFLRVPLDALYRFGFGGYLLQESYSWVFPYLWSDVWKPVLLGIGMILLEFFLFWRIWRRKLKA